MIEHIVDAQPEFGLIEMRAVPEHVVKIDIRGTKGIDRNHLVDNGIVGQGIVIPHRSDPLVEDAKIEVFLLIGQAERLRIGGRVCHPPVVVRIGGLHARAVG